MRIAVAYENGEVFPHFGHTEHFKLYDLRDGIVGNSMVVEALGCGHEALAGFLAEMKVNALICGGIGGGARAALEEAGVLLFGGVTGSADEAVKAFAAGTLQYDPDIHCHYHEGGEGHACGEHSCGDHSCGEHACAGCAHHQAE